MSWIIIALVILYVICKIIEFAVAGIIYAMEGGKKSMAECKDTTQGCFGAMLGFGILIIFIVAIF